MLASGSSAAPDTLRKACNASRHAHRLMCDARRYTTESPASVARRAPHGLSFTASKDTGTGTTRYRHQHRFRYRPRTAPVPVLILIDTAPAPVPRPSPRTATSATPHPQQHRGGRKILSTHAGPRGCQVVGRTVARPESKRERERTSCQNPSLRAIAMYTVACECNKAETASRAVIAGQIIEPVLVLLFAHIHLPAKP